MSSDSKYQQPIPDFILAMCSDRVPAFNELEFYRKEGKMKATPVLYLDIDGTVRKGFDEIGRFVNHADDVEVFEEVPLLIKKYKDAGYRIIGISNQGGIALGLANLQDVEEAFLETNRQCNGYFDKIAFCQHHEKANTPEYAICWCRKPAIGLIVESALSLSQLFNEYYPPHLALFVGDRPEDEECARQARIKFIHAKEWRKGAPNAEG